MIKRFTAVITLFICTLTVLLSAAGPASGVSSTERVTARRAISQTVVSTPETIVPRLNAPRSTSVELVADAVQLQKPSVSKRLRALAWALAQRGKWYVYGTDGPSTFDCSGLVYRAYLSVGINIGRDTYSMLVNRHLTEVSHPQRGDLAFFDNGAHVELYISGSLTTGVSFGAHHSGTQVGYRSYNAWYHPYVFYRVAGAG